MPAIEISEQERLEMIRAIRRQEKQDAAKLKDGIDAPDYGKPLCERLVCTCQETRRLGYADKYPDGHVVIQWGRLREFRTLPTVTECHESELEQYKPRKPSEMEGWKYDLGPDEV